MSIYQRAGARDGRSEERAINIFNLLFLKTSASSDEVLANLHISQEERVTERIDSSCLVPPFSPRFNEFEIHIQRSASNTHTREK